MKTIEIVLAAACVTGATGCATYKSTMTNAQGQQITCEAHGKAGIVTGYNLRKGYEACVADAHARGYK